MNKMIFTLIMSITISFAGMVDGIALVVNDDPITLFDIEKRKYEKKLSKEDAVSQLIDEALFSQLVRKNNITADVFDVNNYLEKLAASNGMDLYTFKSIIKQKYKDYDRYEEQTKNLIIRQKLTDKLVRGNLKLASEEDLKIYYENNSSKFQMASKVSAIQYSSKDKAELINIRKNPMANVPGISKSRVELDQSNLNPQLRYIINETKINQFTPVFTSNKQFVSLLIVEKEDQETIEFENVRDRIFNIVMQDREKKYLKDYFEKLKLSADIKIVR
ncbi:peptidylprolyl isomerase [Arcobacter sp. LA11]|uniref:peptidylprolyl isomerase n=1 Tax=Arcobacter sp. LA11 TaxID=1898176 RepID=UPI000933B82D|nr:peptidylprolyl isomerase [Arcobacter sp. LA11]